MLQPSQLTDVAREYAAEIVELRAFLAKAGVPVGTSQAFPIVAARVRQDRAFHRDLATTLWVTTEGGDRQISFADLLGVLAIASAGVHLASDAEEQDALSLLQFLKEIGRTLKPNSKPTQRLATADPATPQDSQFPEVPILQQVAKRRSGGVEELTGVEHTQPTLASPRAFVESPRNPSPWLVAGACLLFALFLTIWLYRRSSVAQPATQQTAGAPHSETISPQDTPTVRTRSSGERDARQTVTMQPEAHRSANLGAQRSATPGQTDSPRVSSPEQASIKSAQPVDTSSTTSPTVNKETPADLPPVSRSAASPPTAIFAAKTSTRSASPPPVPASTLSKRLGASTVPQYASDQGGQGVADAPKHPRLLRRHPLANGDSGLVAELQPLDNPTARTSSSSSGTAVGSVRPTALGMMAANVLYSPTPPYPTAASAAHVTGEVKLEAEIDRDGTVTYARVVSGPPLLRDAALNAVQQWRYRPYISRGKAVPVTALAVMDFQLP